MRKVAFVAPVLLALALSACTSGDKEAESKDDAKPVSQASTGSETLDLKLPKKADYLVPAISGSGTKDVDTFHPKGDVYTVHLRCEGKGGISLGDGTSDPVQVKCGGPVAIGHVFIDKGVEQSLTVSPDSDKTKWAIAILEGKQKLTP